MGVAARPEVDPKWWTQEFFRGRPLSDIVRDHDIGILLAFLHSRGFGQAALASLTGLSESRVRALLGGKQRVTSYEVLVRIADGLGIDRGLMGLAHAPRPATTLPMGATEPSLAPDASITQSIMQDNDGRSFRAAVGPQDFSLLGQLPADIADFTGRSDEVAYLMRRLTASGSTGMPLCAIHGKGGLGKTTLAIHVAHLARWVFPDGQLYADLRGAEPDPVDPTRLLGRFLTDLGIDPGSIPDDIDERARLFRAVLVRRRVLVVLDNAADESQVRPLLPGTSTCAVIVTSRRRLTGLAGAAHVRLNSMTEAEGHRLLAAIAGADRVAAESQAVGEVGRLCGWLPLALRIAGARLAARPAQSLSEFGRRLRDERSRLDLLATGDLEVRSCFALSYDTCDDRLQRAFRLLGMLWAEDFAAWTLACLAEVNVAEAQDLLEQLVDAELVETSTGGRDGRYRLHDLLRLFAHERLVAAEGPSELRDAAARLLSAYADLGMNAAALLEPGGLYQPCPAHSEPLTQLRADVYKWAGEERQAFVKGVRLAADYGLAESAWRLAELVPVLSRGNTYWAEWEETHRIGLRVAEESGDVTGLARMRNGLGLLRRAQGRYSDAVDELTSGRDLFAQIGDEIRAALVSCHLGDTYRYTGRLHEAVHEFTTALTTFEPHQVPHLRAAALNGLGDAYRGLSRWDAAQDSLQRCIQIYDSLGDRLRHARATVRFAIIFRDRCLFSDAAALYRNCLTAFRDVGDRRWEARTLRHLGVVARNTGQTTAAVEHLRACLVLFEEISDHRGVAVALRNLGDTYRRATDIGQAESTLVRAFTGFEELADTRWQARTLVSLADTIRHRRAWTDATDKLDRALAIYRAIEDTPGEARLWRSRGVLLRDQHDWTGSVEAFAQAEKLYRSLGDHVWTARVIAGSAATVRSTGDSAWSKLYESAEQICREHGAATSAEVDAWLYEW